MKKEAVYGVILAAGKSTRINSEKSKLLLPLCGNPLLSYPVKVMFGLKPEKLFVIVGGVHKDCIISHFKEYPIVFVEQPEARGTGDAVMKVRELIPSDADVVIMPGDVPLIEERTISDLLEFHRNRGAVGTVLTVEHPQPHGYGRIVRSKGDRIMMIVEEKDAFPEEKAIKEINSGIYVFNSSYLFKWLDKLRPDNLQRELYLTDIIEILQRKVGKVLAYKISDYREVIGVNTRQQFSNAAALMQERIINRCIESGVTFVDRRHVYVESDVEIEKDAVIYPFVALLGKTKIGKDAIIGPNVVLRDRIVGEGEEIWN